MTSDAEAVTAISLWTAPTLSVTSRRKLSPEVSRTPLCACLSNPGAAVLISYTPGCIESRLKNPVLSDMAVRVSCCPVRTAVTTAFGTTAPLWSLTNPLIVPDTCPWRHTASAKNIRRLLGILSPLLALHHITAFRAEYNFPVKRHAALVLWLAGCPLSAQTPFTREVAPILAKQCLSCHSAGQQMSQLDLSSRASALKGGQKSGPAIVPGDAAKSPLYRRLIGQDQPAMPLGARLSDAEIKIIKDWIESGAAWDEATVSAAPAAAKPSSDWWAFRPPVRHIPPAAGGNPIDAFILKTLQEQKLEPAPEADRRTLIRRLYLDVIGLLPPPEEVDAFVNDQSPNAWEKRVDQVLGSTHYGERWARHWMDVARYADSWGHIHDDDNPNAWKYRDYIIQSLNHDKPYNRFIVEQIAGDEVDDVSNDTLIATGFHRVGPRVCSARSRTRTTVTSI